MKTFWILVIAAAFFSAPAEAGCVTPKPRALLGRDVVGCCQMISGRMEGAGAGLRWVSVSWEGPKDGNLYVVDCLGAKVAELESLGSVEHVDALPSIGGIPTAKVTYIPATGTGIQLRSVALVQYRGGRPWKLWDHATLDAAYTPPNLGQSYEDRTSWRFLQGHRRIEANTVRGLLGGSRKVLKLHAERYCLRASVWRYVSCK